MFTQIIIQILLIAVNAALVSAETSAVSASDTTVEKLAASGNKKARKLKKLTDKPNSLLSAIHSAASLSALMGSAFAAQNFSPLMTSAFMKLETGISEKIVNAVSVVLTTLIVAFFTIVFGELIPKKASARNSEKTALGMVGFTGTVRSLFMPFVCLTNLIANGILRIFGIDPDKEDNTVTEEEILMMSDAGAENGTIDEDENRIIRNVFAFDNMTAAQICTHRTDVSVLWYEDDISVWEETIHRTRHSVFPICGENVDSVIGVLNAKDYFRIEDKTRENIMREAVHEPYFVHENMKADRLFAEMKKNIADHFAVVADEYGGMSGIITVTDLVEQLVGDFDYDELDEPNASFEKIGENLWMIPGITPLSEVCYELDIELPADKYDTFGGYVIAELGEIPKDGTKTSLETELLIVDVLEITHHRIEICKVSKKAIVTDDESDDE